MAKDLQDINDGDLIEALNDSKEELFNLRFQLVTGQLDNFSRIKDCLLYTSPSPRDRG